MSVSYSGSDLLLYKMEQWKENQEFKANLEHMKPRLCLFGWFGLKTLWLLDRR